MLLFLSLKNFIKEYVYTYTYSKIFEVFNISNHISVAWLWGPIKSFKNFRDTFSSNKPKILSFLLASIKFAKQRLVYLGIL